MIKQFFCFLILTVSYWTYGQQNIVINPSFESALGRQIHEFSRKKNGEQLVYGWSVPTSGTSDYYDYKGSRVYLNRLVHARTDSGRVAVIAGIGRKSIREFFKYPKGYAEYVQGAFARKLQAGQTYCVSFYVAQHPDSKFSVSTIGAYLSDSPLSHKNDYAPLLLEPHVSVESYVTPQQEWFEVSGSYTAKGGEQYITIGNWGVPNIKKTRTLTGEKHHRYSVFNTAAYYFIDDVSVRKSKPESSCTQEKTESIELSQNTHYLILLDVSGSMRGKHYIDSVRANLPSALQHLHPDSRVSLLSFSNKVNSEFLYQQPEYIIQDTSFWNNLNTGGITSYRDAIDKAYEIVDTSEYYESTIVLVSDGEFKVKDELVERVQDNYIKNSTHFSIMMMGEQIIPGDMMKLSTLSKGRSVQFEENDFNDLILNQGHKVLPQNRTVLNEKHSSVLAFLLRNIRPIAFTAVAVTLYLSLR